MNLKRVATALLTAATIAVPFAGQAQAATTKVEIVNNGLPTSNQMARRALQQWVPSAVGDPEAIP